MGIVYEALFGKLRRHTTLHLENILVNILLIVSTYISTMLSYGSWIRRNELLIGHKAVSHSILICLEPSWHFKVVLIVLTLISKLLPDWSKGVLLIIHI